jgi:hypothetical protein
LNLQLQRQRCSRLHRACVYPIKIIFILKTLEAISCVYNAGVVNQSRRIGSWS